MLGALTVRQEEVLAFYRDRHRETGLVPTLQETADHFGFKSPNSVRQHLLLIEKKGFVHRLPGRSRAMVLSRNEAEPAAIQVPLLGCIPAGAPAVAEQDVETVLNLPAPLFRGEQLFALRVSGASMIGAGILDGDLAVLDAKAEVPNGAIAGVRIEDDATLKRVYLGRNELTLKSENPAFSEIKVQLSEAKQVQILGLMIGLVRKI